MATSNRCNPREGKETRHRSGLCCCAFGRTEKPSEQRKTSLKTSEQRKPTLPAAVAGGGGGSCCAPTPTTASTLSRAQEHLLSIEDENCTLRIVILFQGASASIYSTSLLNIFCSMFQQSMMVKTLISRATRTLGSLSSPLLDQSDPIPKSTLMARSYIPSKVSEVVALWREDLNEKAAESLADREDYPNMFENWQIALEDDDNETVNDESNTKSGINHFNNKETDLLKTNAMSKEFFVGNSHLAPPLLPSSVRFVLSLENDLTVRSKTTEVTIKDFSSGSYATIFKEEIRRRALKKSVIVFVTINPRTLNNNNYKP
ncbi:hypothetical protein L1887_31493 [Cichorium endivia]|nr:hypothetical protein L1887_31493 [Cichorium endivia]